MKAGPASGEFATQVIDPQYHCVCVEMTDFTPILFEDVKKRIVEEGGEIGFRSGNGPTM
jgi:hypothetical protein